MNADRFTIYFRDHSATCTTIDMNPAQVHAYYYRTCLIFSDENTAIDFCARKMVSTDGGLLVYVRDAYLTQIRHRHTLPHAIETDPLIKLGNRIKGSGDLFISIDIPRRTVVVCDSALPFRVVLEGEHRPTSNLSFQWTREPTPEGLDNDLRAIGKGMLTGHAAKYKAQVARRTWPKRRIIAHRAAD